MESNFTDITVLYPNTESMDNVTSGDSVVFGHQTCGDTSSRYNTHGFIHMRQCCKQNATVRDRVITGAVLFVIGLIVGFPFGRLSVQCEEPRVDNGLITPHNVSISCSDDRTSTVPNSTSPIVLPTRDSTTHGNDSRSTSSIPSSCVPCNDTSIKQTTSSPSDTQTTSTRSCTFCQTRDADVSAGNETSNSAFAPLTLDEMQAARIAVRIKLNMKFEQSLADDRISHMYLYPADKSAVLKYLDENGSFPGRYAKVHVFRGSRVTPDVMEYKVGPLNLSYTDMMVKELRQDGEIAFNRRPFDTFESNILYEFVSPLLKKTLSALLSESFDGVSIGNGANPSFSFQPSSNITDRVSHMVMTLTLGGAKTIGLLPVSCTVHHPGIMTSRWYTDDWYYNTHGPFSSSDVLVQMYNNGSIPKLRFPVNTVQNLKKDFDLIRNESSPYRELSHMSPPRTYEPEGPRYTVSGHKISWMGWQVEVSSDPIRGPAIFDIRFLGDRIAYEISLQDITLLYSSQTNGRGPLVLSDTFYLIGSYNSPVKNVDCPERGHVISSTTYLAGTRITNKAFCVFEADGQRPLWRHTQRGLAEHYLVVRAALNLGNYDYIVEWNFHLDGRLRTLLTASGYLYGAFWDDSKQSFSPFGYKLGEYLQGPIHDHTYTFKVDLDILDSKNSFETIYWKAGNTEEVFQKQFNATLKPHYFIFNNTRYLTSDILQYESSFTIDSKQPKVWTVVNENHRNRWGSYRGYRIIPETKYGEVLHDHVMFKPWKQLQFQLAVSKRKDNEHYATNSIYEVTHPDADPIAGTMNLDNDNVRNEDLVVWLSEKFYHVPSTEDVPMTLPAQAAFTIKPFNYFDRTPTFDLQARYSDLDAYPSKSCSEPT